MDISDRVRRTGTRVGIFTSLDGSQDDEVRVYVGQERVDFSAARREGIEKAEIKEEMEN